MHSPSPPAIAAGSNGALAASKINRRVGLPPSSRGSATNCTCPDIFELADGNFAVIGTDRTKELKGELPADAGLASYERIVVITQDTLIKAAEDLASSQRLAQAS